ncbi:hypothetical protein D3C83_265180 [compost metagenome]
MTETSESPERDAIDFTTSAARGALSRITVPGCSGFQVLSTRTGMRAFTAGIMVEGWTTFAP